MIDANKFRPKLVYVIHIAATGRGATAISSCAFRLNI